MKLFLFLNLLLLSHLLAQTLAHRKFDSGKHPETQSSLSINSAFGALPSSGYYQAIVTLKNESNEEQTWTVNTSSSANSYYGGKSSETTSEYSLSCPAEQTKVYHLRVPVHNADGYAHYNYASSLSSYSEENNLNFEIKHKNWELFHNISSQHSDDFPNLLITNNTVKLNSATIGEELIERASLFKPDLLTDDLLVLKGYEVICITSDEWNQLSGQKQETLANWCEQGGHLVFYEQKSKVNLDKLDKPKYQSIHTNHVGTSYGLGSYFIKPPFKGKPNEDAQFQTLLFLANYDSYHPLHSNGMIGGWKLSQEFGKQRESTIPIILILILFAVAVGPLNFYVFAKQGRRHRLFFTTAAISAISSVVLISIIFIKDGVGGEGIRLVHKEIDSSSNTSLVTQEQVSKSGLLLETSFEIKEPCTVVQLNHHDDHSLNIQQTEQGVLCSGDFFQSKSRQGQLLIANQISQEKFEIRQEGDKLYVTSTFSNPIDSFYYTDKKTVSWKADNLKTGGEVQLTQVDSEEFEAQLTSITESCSSYMSSSILTLADRPNSFVAYSSQGKGIETLASISWKTQALYTGRLQP